MCTFTVFSLEWGHAIFHSFGLTCICTVKNLYILSVYCTCTWTTLIIVFCTCSCTHCVYMHFKWFAVILLYVSFLGILFCPASSCFTRWQNVGGFWRRTDVRPERGGTSRGVELTSTRRWGAAERETERDRWDTCMTACLRKGTVHAVSVKGRSYYIYLWSQISAFSDTLMSWLQPKRVSVY